MFRASVRCSRRIRPGRAVAWCAGLACAALLFGAVPARAQYPLIPSDVLNTETLRPTPHIGGYLSLLTTVRHDSTSFTINRGRLTVTTAPLPWLAIKLQGDLSGGVSGHVSGDSAVRGFELTDAYAQITPPDSVHLPHGLRPALLVGQFKQPFSLEYLTSFAYLRTASRSEAVNQLAPKRDIGVQGQVTWRSLVTAAVSATNGEGANALDNRDGRQLVMGRLTVRPVSWLALAGKMANEGGDHARGYDARLIWRQLIVEGEGIHRSRPLAGGVAQDAGGGYVLAAWRALPWLQPLFKQEWYADSRSRDGVSTTRRENWSTAGFNLESPGESLRLQVDWVWKAERPTPVRNDELDVQVIASF